jgi:hypothetical protein
VQAGAAELSGADLRRALRALPLRRRRAIARAVREGRAADDPRDAAMALAVAQRIQASPWPRWALPQARPRGRSALLWSAHAIWVLAVVLATVIVPAWRIGGNLRWIVLGLLGYGIVSIPWVLAFVLRARWNAPEAERRNRELLDAWAHPRPEQRLHGHSSERSSYANGLPKSELRPDATSTARPCGATRTAATLRPFGL